MLTRCPACATHFRVTAEQIRARAGRVRCGACQHAFNALDSLIEEPAVVLAPAATDDSAAALAVPPEPTFEPADTPQDATVAVESDATAASSDTAPPEGDADPAAEAADEAAAAEDTAAQTPEPDPDDWPEIVVEPPRPRRWPWVIGSLAALVALGMQAALAFRVELAVLWPEAKPALASLCATAGCEVGLPAKPALVGIEASDLHPESEQKGRLALTATLKNRAPFAQQFPHLELTLTDTADKAVARKVLAPADYLTPAVAVANGMQANADIVVTVGIDSGEMAASGYRLYLFYP